MFKKLKISQKLVIFMVLIGVIPLLLGILFANDRVSHQLEEEAFHKLEAVQAIKAQQVQDYIKVLEGQLHIAKDDPYIYQALYEFDQVFEAEDDKVLSPAWNALAKKYESRIKDILADNHWYDLYLIHFDGDIVFTAQRESDLGMVIPDSELKKSSLGEAFQKAQSLPPEEIAKSDFKPYAPSGGAPAAFMMGQIRDDKGTLLGYVALQFPIKKIDEIMLERVGMGETGETYLVGPDKRMRSVAYLDQSGRNVKASFAGTIEKNGVDTEAVREVFAGRSGEKMLTNYLGELVISVYSPVKFGDVSWALIAEIDDHEALGPARKLRTILFVMLGILGLIVAAVGYFLARSISNPINIMVNRSKDLAEGRADLTQRIQIESQDELGDLGGHFNGFIERIQELIKKVKTNSDNVSSSSLEISTSSEQLAATVEEQSTQSQSVSTAVTQLTATSDDISKSIENTRSAAEESATLTKDGGKVIQKAIDSLKSIEDQTGNLGQIIGNLGNSTQKIGNIISVINDVADQTNLLALNAAIEAARAGDAGRGFAVVADEVRKLAERTAKATKEIEEIITQLQQEAGNAESAMGDAAKEVQNGTQLGRESLQILDKIVISSDNIFNAAIAVASAVTEENATIEEVGNNVQGIAAASEESANAVQEVASTAEDLSRQAEALKEMVDQFIT
jgi:methyl-accepting chemotaxis protein